MVINTTAPHLLNKSQKMQVVGLGGGGTVITQSHQKKFMLIFITSHLSFKYHGIYYTNTISNKITGNYWLQKTTLHDKFSNMYHKWHSTTCYLVDYNLSYIHFGHQSYIPFNEPLYFFLIKILISDFTITVGYIINQINISHYYFYHYAHNTPHQ